MDNGNLTDFCIGVVLTAASSLIIGALCGNAVKGLAIWTAAWFMLVGIGAVRKSLR